MSSFGQIFGRDTQAIFYNWKPSPVQRMLDFDFLCGRSNYSNLYTMSVKRITGKGSTSRKSHSLPILVLYKDLGLQKECDMT